MAKTPSKPKKPKPNPKPSPKPEETPDVVERRRLQNTILEAAYGSAYHPGGLITGPAGHAGLAEFQRRVRETVEKELNRMQDDEGQFKAEHFGERERWQLRLTLEAAVAEIHVRWMGKCVKCAGTDGPWGNSLHTICAQCVSSEGPAPTGEEVWNIMQQAFPHSKVGGGVFSRMGDEERRQVMAWAEAIWMNRPAGQPPKAILPYLGASVGASLRGQTFAAPADALVETGGAMVDSSQRHAAMEAAGNVPASPPKSEQS